MRKILRSLLVIGLVVGAGVAGTVAYYNDREESLGNFFQAGAIDLQVDNTSWLNYNPETGEPVENGFMVAYAAATWGLKDLGAEDLFFNFSDVKPGDLGEDTISFHIFNNPAWLCVDVDITANDDNTCTEPELDDDPNCTNPGLGQGELADQLQFVFWADDGDNVLEDGEQVLTQGTPSEILDGVTWALADSQGNVWDEQGPIQPFEGEDQERVYYIGKAWCYGELALAPLGEDDGTPADRGPGVTCNGEPADNSGQTDYLEGDIVFRAVQARHNERFVCERPQEPRPVVDGIADDGEWEGCTQIDFAGGKGTACVLAYTDYMYVLYQINDPTDDRLGENSKGNDQLGLNINPSGIPASWGKPYDIVMQTGTDPAAFTTPVPDVVGSSGLTDSWESEWVVGGIWAFLPGDVETMTPTYSGGPTRVSEWKLPLSSIAGLLSGDILDVGGAVDIGDGSSYVYPVGLDWNNPATFADVVVQ